MNDHYSCDLGAENACPPGMVCVEVTGGENRCRFESCLPWECAGCCDGEGTCLAGTEDTACGTEGELCVDCAARDQVCLDGECVHQCRKACTDGCCNNRGDCLTGNDDDACGRDGEVCVNCTGSGLVCDGGECVVPCDCTSGVCCDGCDFLPDTTRCDTTPVDTEERCSSVACGARRDGRSQYRYCTGESAHCGDGNLVWDAWTTLETCGSDDLCQDDGDTTSCVTCVGGCSSGACNCQDLDGDGHYAGAACPSLDIDDCDDNAPGITGACQANGCPQGWVLIEAGEFEMGCNDGEISPCYEDERPRRTVTLSAYCIQPTEVTVAEYRECYEEPSSGCTAPGMTSSTPECNFATAPSDRESHPINCVTWTEARAFCQDWVGGDLPSEAQWEKAARGDDQRLYPWGPEDPDCTRCNWDYSGDGAPYGCGDVPEDTGPVTWEVGHISGTEGDSPYGLKDMAGNLWEYVLDCYDETGYPACAPPCTDPVVTSCTNPDWMGVRGGGFNQAGVQGMRTFNRYHQNSKTTWSSSFGLRCVRIP